MTRTMVFLCAFHPTTIKRIRTQPRYTAENVGFPTVALPLLALERRFRLSAVVPKRLSRAFRRWITRFGRRPVMPPDTRRWLIDHYAPHNRALEQIIEKDLSHWNTEV